MTQEIELNEIAQNSICLKKDSKGQYNWDIKIYFKDENNALNLIEKINNELKNKYGEK